MKAKIIIWNKKLCTFLKQIFFINYYCFYFSFFICFRQILKGQSNENLQLYLHSTYSLYIKGNPFLETESFSGLKLSFTFRVESFSGLKVSQLKVSHGWKILLESGLQISRSWKCLRAESVLETDTLHYS